MLAHMVKPPLRSVLCHGRYFSTSCVKFDKNPSSSSSPESSSSNAQSTKPLVRESSTSPESLNSQPLPYLSFALGLPNPPSSHAETWSEKRARLTSSSYQMENRKAIVREATRGYFHDFHAIRSHGGKTWRSPTTLIKSENSRWFPRIQGTRLSDKSQTNTVTLLKNKISIVALLNSKISEEHTKSFYQPAVNSFDTSKDFQLVQINLQQNPLKNYLVNLFLSSLRGQIDEKLQRTYLLSGGISDGEKEAIALHNKHVGYTYLVDEEGRIRWAGCAFAEQAESNALLACTGVLLDRFKQKKVKK
ncbi:related to ATP10 - F1F0 ATPase complex assembly protein [Ustilago trichophora]|uniref:Related to ATP10 - F1F0 ATPase complex assembly protein n=1 Tax=Ustilago trichophora TaxID=86804 RepID=A0A5C3EAB5_9BASI|nr:related to ATP10 - F1F0 ATPase complex assembly protein [Ustilago trichophora]